MKLNFPSLQEFYEVPNQKNLSESEVKDLIKEAIRLKISSSNNPDNLQDAINMLIKAAGNEHGAITAAYHLGVVCEGQGEWDLAMKWYVTSFQNSWLQNPAESHQSLAFKRIVHLGNAGNSVFKDLKKIPLIYSADISTPLEKVCRYSALKELYGTGTAEPYLSMEENELRIAKLKEQLVLEAVKIGGFEVNFNIHQYPLKYVQEIIMFFFREVDQAINYIKQGYYKEAEQILLSARPYSSAFHNLGFLYESGYVKGGRPNYQIAASFFKKSINTGSLFSLGNLYFNGKIGTTVDGKRDYQTAMMYFELSATPDALCNLGLIFREGYVGAPDYEKAKAYFEQSDNGRAHFLLARLYTDGLIGEHAPNPDYEKAKEHLEISANKGLMGAYNSLGGLYMKGEVGSINGVSS